MDEIDYEQQESDASMGQACIMAIAKSIGCKPDQKVIERAIYNGTICGAWVEFTETGVMVGSIVEGSCADTKTYNIEYPGDIGDEDAGFVSSFWKALDEVEYQASCMWEEANN